AALRLVELHGRNADIEHDGIDRLSRDGVEFGEPAMHEPQFSGPAGFQRPAGSDRLGIAIDGDDRSAALQKRSRIATGPECAVNDGLALDCAKRSKDLIEKNRNVAGRSATGRAYAAGARHHSMFPADRPAAAVCRSFE